MLITLLTQTLQRFVGDRVTPGGVVGYGRLDGESQVVPFGTVAGPGTDSVTVDTIYDVASLTKPVVTAALAMSASADGFDLATPLLNDGRRVPTVHQALGHAAGYPAHVEFYHRLWDGDFAGAPDARRGLYAMAAATPLASEPGARALYSDIGYILLGALLERTLGARLDELAHDHIFEPLAMSSTGYVDLERTAHWTDDRTVAPTEVCPRRGEVRAQVHDENAHAAGGICGHAGVFSTASDLCLFARALLRAARGSTETPFAPDTVTRFFGEAAAPETSWRLGWDTPSQTAGVSHAGDAWPRTAVGHLGFTGTSMWLDVASSSYAVILTNRVHPTRDGGGIKALRRDVMDQVWSLLLA